MGTLSILVQEVLEQEVLEPITQTGMESELDDLELQEIVIIKS